MEKDRKGTSDIMVFSFTKYSQLKSVENANHEYDYVFKILNKLLSEHGVDVPKIGIGGYIEDVASYIAFIIKAYQLNGAISSIEISDLDPDEFDPEIEPIKFPNDLGSDHANLN
jgi:hypothetical protein